MSNVSPLGGSDSEPCDACDGHGFYVEGQNPGRIKACAACSGSRITAGEESEGDMGEPDHGPSESGPPCETCGARAPYGDERFVWLRVHESWSHRLWWAIKRKIGRAPCR